jgi:hypothetical protein
MNRLLFDIVFSVINIENRPGLVVHTYNPSYLHVVGEEGGNKGELQFEASPGKKVSKTLSQRITQASSTCL